MEFALPLLCTDDQTSISCKSWQRLKQRFKDFHTLKQPASEHRKVSPSSSLLMHISGNKIRDVIKAYYANVHDEDVDRMFGRIEDLCMPSFILLYERFKFFSFKQKKLDDVRNFVSELQMMGTYCELQEQKDKYITGRIMNGVYSETLRKHLQNTADLDLQKAIEICIEAVTSFNDKHGTELLEEVEKVVETEPCILSEKNDNRKACTNRHGVTARKGKSNKVAIVRKDTLKDSAEQVPATSVSVPLRRQTRSSSTCPRRNVQSSENSRRERFVRSRRKTPATEAEAETPFPKNCMESDDKIFHHPDNSSCISNSPMIHPLDETSEEKTLISLSYIPEDVVMNEVFSASGKSANVEESGTEILQFEDHHSEDSKTGIQLQDVRNSAAESQTAGNGRSKKCLECGLTFTTAYLLKCHVRTHSGQRLYTCSICQMGFVHCGSRSRHMRQAHPESLTFSCDECDMFFERQKALDQHKLSHSKQGQITCEDCGMNFMSTREHYQHRRRVHRNTRYKCDKCGQHFPYPSKLKLHLMSKHNATKPYMCEICGSSFAEKNMLITHKNIHSGEKKHECSTCGQRFLLKTTLNNHIQTHLDGKPHTCDVCGLGFKLSYYLKSHMKIHSSNRERPYICSKCGAAFLKLAQLRNHERRHTGEKPYKCEICNAMFSQLSSMKKHVKQIHEGLKPKDRFSCEYCGLSFTHSCKLKLHLMKHTGERPFACKLCGSTYRENHQLTSHMKIHDGNEPFKCHLCGRRFLQKSSLEGHIRKHTGEKPFKCPVCSLSFSHKGYLRDHAKVHDQNRERKYKCSICEKAFTCSSHMRSHERLHSGEKPHKCDICGSRFTKRSSMKKHLRRTHGIQDCMSQSRRDQNLAVAQNVEESAGGTVSQLHAVDVTCQVVHPGMSAEIQPGIQLAQAHPELQVDQSANLRPVPQAGLTSQIQPVQCGLGSETQDGTQPHLQQSIYPGIHTLPSNIHCQMHQHPGICIIHPDIHPHIHTALHTQILPDVASSLSAQIQQSVQEMHIYTLAS